MTAARQPFQYEAADLRFEPDDGLRRELYDGVMHVVPPASDDHAWGVDVGYHAIRRRARSTSCRPSACTSVCGGCSCRT